MTWTLFTQLMILGTWLPLWATVVIRSARPRDQHPWGDGSSRTRGD